MTNVTITGAQWGDEGKGKLTDWLSARADMVVRFQGGHNAGHTLVIDGRRYVLSLAPSGIMRKDALCVIGGGVVVDPWALLDEIDRLNAAGVEASPRNLKIADTVCLILPSHAALDRADERSHGEGRIGTTGRGIGPAYEDKVGRRALRLCDLESPAVIEDKTAALIRRHNILLSALGQPKADADAVIASLKAIAPRLAPYAARVWSLLREEQQRGGNILFEGAQGIMLDVEHGTYPYVTSSHTVAAQAASGVGCAPRATGLILGVSKAYATRVGNGCFPSEADGAAAARLAKRGGEIGAVTGRRRRCGWLDAVMLRQAAMTAGFDALALTKLDVLDVFEDIQLCVAYQLDGRRLTSLPAATHLQERLQPIWRRYRGWMQSTAAIERYEDLPAAARAYLSAIENEVGLPIILISTAAERERVICRLDPFAADAAGRLNAAARRLDSAAARL